MSEELGPVRYASPAGAGYLDPELRLRTTSAETDSLIDQEARRLIEEAQDRALDLLGTNEAAVHEIARRLQDVEVLRGEEVADIVEEARAPDDDVLRDL